MSENFGTNPGFDQAPNQHRELSYTALVEDHASQLMDELFQEIDANSRPSDQLSSPISQTSQAIPSAASQLALAVKTDELQDNLLVPYVEMDAILEPLYDADTAPEPTDKDEKKLGSYLPLGLAWGAFLGSASLLALTQFNAFMRAPSTVQAAVPAIATAQPQDVAFATELSDSLQAVENTSPPPVPIVATALPSLAPTLRTESILATLPSVVSPPSQSNVGLPKAKAPVVASAKLQPPQTVALATLSNRLPVLSGGQTQSNSFTPPNLPPSVAPQALPMSRQAKSGVTIQGILDLGAKSAILISRNGSTQNIRPGEVLDATGWVFLRVENGQAILQRGNETRSVSGGEQF
jgi:hypothetical protein